jgi:hypothetical protein
MNFIIENNKFDKKWYKIEAYTVPESDEIRTKLGACLFHVEDNQIAIYQLLLLGDKNDEFYNKIERFARSLYIKSISIGLFELLDLDKIFFLKSQGFTATERKVKILGLLLKALMPFLRISHHIYCRNFLINYPST